MSSQASRLLQNVAPYWENQATILLYNKALARGRRGQVWSVLTGRSHGLLALEEVSQACPARARCSAGTRTVPIAQICGSEGRAGDFDRDFNPLQEHTKARWLSIASVLQRGRCLPPVALIQVGDRYFVRDGHHRISVARALGQKDIDATVEVWQVEVPLRATLIQTRRLDQCSIPRLLSGNMRPADGAGACPVF